jgi:O-antigen/teichoic acid export membrane protein
MLRTVINRAKPKSEFACNVLTLMTGTTIAQAIPIALSPILTRLYTPEDFGALALYMAILGVLSSAATGRYELAVMLAEKEEDANALVVLSLLIAAALGLFTLLAVAIFNEPITKLLGNAALGHWLYAVPVGLFLTGAYNTLNYWLNRHSRYTAMSQNRVLQSGITGSVSLGLGWVNCGAIGLISGNVFGQAVTTALLGNQFMANRESPPIERATLRKSIELAMRYKNHPMHLLPSQWIGAAAMQIPVFVISGAFGPSITGFFSLALRMISMPGLLIADAIGDVYRQQATVAYREAGQFRTLFLKTLTKSFKFAVLPFAVLFAIAPDLFAFVFGEPWRMAGDYSRILSIAAFFQFVFTPIDKGALVVGATRYIFLWHLARLVGLAAIGFMTIRLRWSVTSFMLSLVMVTTLLYFVEGFMNYRFSLPERAQETSI